MLEITPKGQKRLSELQTRESDLRREFPEASTPLIESERRQLVKRLDARWQHINPQFSVLWELDQYGPLPRSYFYWNREQPLQEGYIKVFDRARNRVIDELVSRGYITETADN